MLQRQDQNQRIWNLFEEPESSDPDRKWRSRSVRAGARNSVISIAAHLVSAMMYPNFTAQNDQDEDDRDAASVMRDMILWNIENSDYDISMLFGVIAAAVNPCGYMSVEYAESFQKVRADFEGKDIGVKDVLDHVVSGLQVAPMPLEEVLISNIYQYEHQKQPSRSRDRWISYEEAEARYGEHKYWRNVRKGQHTVFDAETQQFYDIDDTDKSEGLVQEIIVSYRSEDLEIPYVSGIYMGHDKPAKNPIRHRRLCYDRDGGTVSVPVYPETKFGYEPIDEKRFYYYKSVIDKQLPDHKRLEKMARLAEDATVLEVLKPALVSGKARINQSVIFPASVTSVPENSKVDFLSIGAAVGQLWQHIQDAEQQMSKSSQDDIRQGSAPQGDRTAYELSRIERNAIVKEFAIYGRMIGRAVEDIGGLMADCIIHHQTTLDAEEVIEGMPRLKDRRFLLRNQSKDGRKVTKEMIFTDEYMGRSMLPEELEEESWKVYDEQEERGGNVEIFKVNPHAFARLEYLATCEADSMMPKSMAFEEDRKLRAYQFLIADQFADPEAVARDFLFDPLTEGKADKYMRKASDLGIGMPMQQNQPGAGPQGAPQAAGASPQPVPAMPETSVLQ